MSESMDQFNGIVDARKIDDWIAAQIQQMIDKMQEICGFS